jgi:hypothetical protein
MVLVLLVDIGLAAAGAVLLSKGLSSKDTNKSESTLEPAPAREQKSEAPARPAPPQAALAPATPTSPAPEATAAAASAAIAVPAAPRGATSAPASAAMSGPGPAARKDTTKQRDDKRRPAATATATASPAATAPAPGPSTATSDEPRPVSSIPTTPQDPYADPEQEARQEIEAVAARSKPAFDRCASEHGPARGAITIAFRVKPDGRVANAAAVENSTGNGELARCLAAEIASWRVSAHGGPAINIFWPFTFP